jgi:hypothetical protein
MTSSITHKEIATGYLVAGVTLCLGFYFGIKAEGDAGTMLVRVFYLLAVLIVLKFTFAWGRSRGFAARREDGRIALSHVLRNLVMAAIVMAALSFLFAPVMMLMFKITR